MYAQCTHIKAYKFMRGYVIILRSPVVIGIDYYLLSIPERFFNVL